MATRLPRAELIDHPHLVRENGILVHTGEWENPADALIDWVAVCREERIQYLTDCALGKNPEYPV